MSVEVNRIVRDWLAALGANGLNSRLSALPKDPGDVVPAIVTFADETSDVAAAQARPAEPYPSCTITVADERIPEIEGVAPTQDFEVDVLLQLTYGGPKHEENIRNVKYALRAATLSLRVLHRQENDSARRRNDVQLYSCLAFNPLGVATKPESTEITGGLLITYRGRDIAA